MLSCQYSFFLKTCTQEPEAFLPHNIHRSSSLFNEKLPQSDVRVSAYSYPSFWIT